MLPAPLPAQIVEQTARAQDGLARSARGFCFYQETFGARITHDSTADDFRYLHVDIGTRGLWLIAANEHSADSVGRQTAGHPLGGVYVSDVEATMDRAVAAGAAIMKELDADNTARYSHVSDNSGNETCWWSCSRPTRANAPSPKSDRSACSSPARGDEAPWPQRDPIGRLAAEHSTNAMHRRVVNPWRGHSKVRVVEA